MIYYRLLGEYGAVTCRVTTRETVDKFAEHMTSAGFSVLAILKFIENENERVLHNDEGQERRESSDSEGSTRVSA